MHSSRFEVESFVNKFLDLSTRGYWADLHLFNVNGSICATMQANLGPQDSCSFKPHLKPSRIRRRRKRREQAEQSSNSPNYCAKDEVLVSHESSLETDTDTSIPNYNFKSTEADDIITPHNSTELMCASSLPQVVLPEHNYLPDLIEADTVSTDEDSLPSDTDLEDKPAVANLSTNTGDDNLSKIVDDFKEKFKDDLTVNLKRELMKIDFSSLLQPP